MFLSDFIEELKKSQNVLSDRVPCLGETIDCLEDYRDANSGEFELSDVTAAQLEQWANEYKEFST